MTLKLPDGLTIEQYDTARHYLRFAPLFSRYYREVNQENVETEIAVTWAGKQQLVRRLDAEMANLFANGAFCRVAIVDDEIIGFLIYRACMHHFVLPIDAFYIRKEFRASGMGRYLIESFCNPHNRGYFEIVAFIHEDRRPEEMLQAFHDWREVRSCNDRDLVMIRGTWKSSLYQEKDPALEAEFQAFQASLAEEKNEPILRSVTVNP